MQANRLWTLAVGASLPLFAAQAARAQGDIAAPPVAHGSNTQGIDASSSNTGSDSATRGSTTGQPSDGSDGVVPDGPTQGSDATGGSASVGPFGSCATPTGQVVAHSLFYGTDGSQNTYQLLQYQSQQVVVTRTGANRDVTCATLGNVGTEWTPIQVGNYSGMHDPGATAYVVQDILWRRSTDSALMIMALGSSLQVNGVSHFGAVGPEWVPVSGAVDLDGDNLADVVTRDSNNGAVAVYFVKDDVPLASSFAQAQNSVKSWCRMGATGQPNGVAESLMGYNGVAFSSADGLHSTFYYNISIDPKSPPSAPSCLFKYQTLD